MLLSLPTAAQYVMKIQNKVDFILDFTCQYIFKMHESMETKYLNIRNNMCLKETICIGTQINICFEQTKTSKAEKNFTWISDVKIVFRICQQLKKTGRGIMLDEDVSKYRLNR